MRLIVLAGLILIFQAVYSQQVDLDPTFGVNGIVWIDYNFNAEFFTDMSLTADGKILLAGFAPYSSCSGIVRMLPDGTLDPSFVEGGLLCNEINDNTEPFVFKSRSIVEAGDYISVLGQFGSKSQNQKIVFLESNGMFHSSFETTGLGGYHLDNSPDGSVVAAGDGDFSPEIRLFKVHPNNENSDFGTDHAETYIYTSTDNNSTVRDIAVLPNENIIVAGQSDHYMAVGRINGNSGSPDTTFGENSSVRISLVDNDWSVFNAVAIQDDGKIVCAGQYRDYVYEEEESAIVVRLNVDGSLDVNFGENGIVMLETDSSDATEVIYDLDIQPDGRILLLGRNPYCFVARLDTDGSPDLTFVNSFYKSISDFGVEGTLPNSRVISLGNETFLFGSGMYPISNPGYSSYMVLKANSAQWVVGDLNGDGAIDINDLLILLGDVGCLGDGCIADFDNNGVTSVIDLIFFLSLVD